VEQDAHECGDSVVDGPFRGDDAASSAAIVDRLTYDAAIIETGTISYRLGHTGAGGPTQAATVGPSRADILSSAVRGSDGSESTTCSGPVATTHSAVGPGGLLHQGDQVVSPGHVAEGNGDRIG